MLDGILLVIQGFFLGLALAAPVGPIGLLCIRRTLEHGPGIGVATGLGAAIADTVFGAVAVFGLTTVLTLASGYDTTLRLCGGLFLLVIAIKTWDSRPAPPDDVPDTRSYVLGFAIGLGVTLTNPVTILAFVGVFATVGIGGTLGHLHSATLVAGVFLGSAAWWLALCSGIAMIRHRVSEDHVLIINRYTALALAVFGIWALSSAGAALFLSPPSPG